MDRTQLFDTLSNLPPAAFERLLFAVKPPGGLIPGDTAPQINRVKALLDWAEGSSGRGTDEIWAYLGQTQTDLADYLTSLVDTYENWWYLYPLTEAISARQATFTFEQSAQTDERSKKDPMKKETVPLPQLLQGIIDYAELEPVLLVGSPGEGKSTTLLRLLANLAKQELQKPTPRIPVLIRLKDYQPSLSSSEDVSGVLALIKESLEPELILETSEIKTLLFQEKRLFLLLDGLNEIPADVARNKLTNFRDQCKRAKVPLICTTRYLDDDFGIQRKVELRPLSPKEIHRFLSECMPGQEQQVIQVLDRGNQELSKTPFVLWMLYDVFMNSGQVPESWGESFSRFTKNYTNYKINQEGIPYSQEMLQNWSFSLEYLAFEMLKLPDPQDPGLVIAERQAVTILTQFPSENEIDLIQSQALLNNLLKYHLLQKSHKGEVSFCHQLIQEYYAAEYLLKLLPTLTDDQLKEDYLNLLKWTEPIALMLALVSDEGQALRVVRLAIKVDLMLGAKLAGKVQPETQAKTVRKISELEVPKLVKIHLSGKTCSNLAIPDLLPFLSDEDFDTRYVVAQALGNIQTDTLVREIVPILQSEHSSVRLAVIKTLQNISTEKSEEQLISLLDHSSSETRQAAATSLGKIGSKKATDKLLTKLTDPDASMRRKVIESLGEIGCDESIPQLTNALEDSGFWVSICAVYALGKIGNKKVIPELIKVALNDNIPELQKAVITVLEQFPKTQEIQELLLKGLNSTSSLTRQNAVMLAGELKLEEFKYDFMRLLSDDVLLVQIEAISALGKIKALEAKTILTGKLKSEDPLIRLRTVIALNLIGFQDTTSNLSEILGDTDPLVRANAVYALSLIGEEESVKDIISALKDPIFSVRKNAVLAIKFGEFDESICVSPLLEILENKEEEDWIRAYAAETLALINTIPAISASMHSLKDSSPIVRRGAIKGLRTVKTREVIQAVSEVLNDDDKYVQHEAASALGEIGESQDLVLLKSLLRETGEVYLLDMIASIQNRCKLYNYETRQEAEAIQSTKLEIKKSKQDDVSGQVTNHFPNATVVKIFEQIENYHEYFPNSNP